MSLRCERVEIFTFRNLQTQSLSLHPKLNVLIGPNGQGKTNFLEAIQLLHQGRSFRGSETYQLLPFSLPVGEEFVSIKCKTRTGLLEDDLVFQVPRQSSPVLQKNGKKISARSLQTIFPVVAFFPESLDSIKAGPDVRRALIDEALHQSEFWINDVVSDYKKVLASRNRILRQVAAGEIEPEQAEMILESLWPNFLKSATLLTCARIEFLTEILADLRSFIQRFGYGNVDIFVEYVISEQVASSFTAQQVRDVLEIRQKQLAKAEKQSGTSLVGPHKHDIRFLFNKKDARFFCSQGQQRTLILAFKMSQIVYHKRTQGTEPILLLDDVLSELDPQRRQLLSELLKDGESQTFLTTTEKELLGQLNPDEYKLFHVENGRLQDGKERNFEHVHPTNC